MSAVAVGVGVGVAGVAAAGASIYAANKQSDATKDANRANSRATAKFMAQAKEESKRGFEDTNKILETYRGEQSKLSDTFGGRLGENVSAYAADTATTLKSYNDAVDQLVKGSEAAGAAFKLETADLAERSASQTFEYNLSRLNDFTKFAEDLSLANQKTRQKLILDANPDWEKQKQQAALTNTQMMMGLIPSDVAAQVSRVAAQTSLDAGTKGGQLSRNLTARDFGGTSNLLMKEGGERALAWQQKIFDQEVNGTQVGVGDVLNTQGLNVQNVMESNRLNALAGLDQKNKGINLKYEALGNSLTNAFNFNTNILTTKNAALNTVYDTESATLRDYISGKVGAVTDRTNTALGIEAQGLSNSYANANRTLQSNLASAQLIGGAISTLGGVAGGAIAGGAFGGGYASMAQSGMMPMGFGGYGGTRSYV